MVACNSAARGEASSKKSYDDESHHTIRHHRRICPDEALDVEVFSPGHFECDDTFPQRPHRSSSEDQQDEASSPSSSGPDDGLLRGP